MRSAHLSIVSSNLPDPPYPPDTKTKGWRFELDLHRVWKSDTWVLCPPDMRPWLYHIWAVAFEQQPAGSLPLDHALIAAHIGLEARMFAAHSDVLLRGFVLHSDNRLYHPVVVERVLTLLGYRANANQRKKVQRSIAETVKDRDDRKCVYCGAETYLTVDHVVPVSLGGSNDLDNLACACKSCNSQKRDRLPEDAGIRFLNDSDRLRFESSADYKKFVTRTNSGRTRTKPFVTTQEQEQELEEKKEVTNVTSMSPGKPSDDVTTGKGNKIEPCPHQQIIALYHDTLPELPRIVLSRWPGSKSEPQLRARWREDPRHQSLDFWVRFFNAVRGNPFWLGQNDRGWTADLHWFVRRQNFDKVVSRMAQEVRRAAQ